MIYDITRPLFRGTAVFPGDTPVSLIETLSLARGDSCTVSALTMSLHAGTHIDAPRHYAPGAPGIDAMRLDDLVGPARVIDAPVRGPISLSLAQTWPLDGVTRLLIHTPASDTPPDVFDPDFAWFTPEAADCLGRRGVRLLGTDAPSVDEAASVDLPAHKVFLRHAITLIENLCLRGVPAGDYQLIALPLRIVDGDAGPARVILIG